MLSKYNVDWEDLIYEIKAAVLTQSLDHNFEVFKYIDQAKSTAQLRAGFASLIERYLHKETSWQHDYWLEEHKDKSRSLKCFWKLGTWLYLWCKLTLWSTFSLSLVFGVLKNKTLAKSDQRIDIKRLEKSDKHRSNYCCENLIHLGNTVYAKNSVCLPPCLIFEKSQWLGSEGSPHSLHYQCFTSAQKAQ